MKRKILLSIIMVATLLCLFAISVSAAEWFGEVEIIDNNGDGVSDIAVTDRVPNAVLEGEVKTEDALVKLSCDCAKGEHTFPAYYVTVINGYDRNKLHNLNYAALNGLKADYCGGTAEYTLDNVVAFEIPAGYTGVAPYIVKKAKSIKYFSFAKLSTATRVDDASNGNNWLEATPVEEINIGPYLTKVPTFVCYNCDSLTSVTIPDQIVTVGTYAFNGCDNLSDVYISKNSSITTFEGQCFKNCVSLTAFYIPSGVTSFGINGSGSSPIDGCKALYFISDPDNREKPSTYYFPSTVTAIVGEAFKNCVGLNDTLVFHSGITSVDNGWAFCNSNAINVVFLGNMTNVSTTGNAWNKNIAIYFCNENDKSASDLSISTGAKTVYCYADGNTTHLFEKTLETDANCENPKMVADYCFCGSIIGTPVTEGEALGHLYEGGEVSYSFVSLTAGGTKCTACVRGCGVPKTEELPAVYTALGYSAKTFDTSKFSLTSGYKVNVDMLELYESENNVTISFGYAFNAASSFTSEENITLDSFKLTALNTREANGVKFGYHDFKISYTDETHIGDDIIVAAYVIEKSQEGESLVFLNRGEGAYNGFEGVSYSSIVSE